MKSYFEVKNIDELCLLLGLSPAESQKIKVRLQLAKAIRSKIEKNQLTHLKAATKAKVGRTVITAIMNGNLERISTDRLLDVGQALGLRFQLKVA